MRQRPCPTSQCVSSVQPAAAAAAANISSALRARAFARVNRIICQRHWHNMRRFLSLPLWRRCVCLQTSAARRGNMRRKNKDIIEWSRASISSALLIEMFQLKKCDEYLMSSFLRCRYIYVDVSWLVARAMSARLCRIRYEYFTWAQ